MRKAILIMALLLAFVPAQVWAGCKSDCRDQYESEVDSCRLLHDDPEDSDMLRICIDSAKDEYDSCIDECEN